MVSCSDLACRLIYQHDLNEYRSPIFSKNEHYICIHIKQFLPFTCVTHPPDGPTPCPTANKIVHCAFNGANHPRIAITYLTSTKFHAIEKRGTCMIVTWSLRLQLLPLSVSRGSRRHSGYTQSTQTLHLTSVTTIHNMRAHPASFNTQSI